MSGGNATLCVVTRATKRKLNYFDWEVNPQSPCLVVMPLGYDSYFALHILHIGE